MGFSSLRIKALIMVASIVLTPRPGTETSSKIAEYMNAEVKTNHFSGAVLVAQKGEVLLTAVYGMSETDMKVPSAPNSRFRLGGIAHQFTAIAIMELAEAGKLSLQDPACRYIAGCPSGWQEVKIVNLLSHTSGISDFSDYNSTSMLPTVVPQVLSRYQNKPLEFKPGERLKYSNFGYGMLGTVIEKVSHRVYAKYLEERIFKPLGMHNTGYKTAGAGFYSTVGDLYLWDRALYGGKLVSKEFLAQMFIPYRDGYGFGWKTLKEFQRRVLTNPPGAGGLSAVIRRYPDDDVCIIVLSGMENANSEKISFDLGAIVFDVDAGRAK
jgi:CubicO group peptidase (beta-lactamase class C family)